MTAWVRFAAALLAVLLLLAGPFVPAVWLYTQWLNHGACRDSGAARVTEESWRTERWPPRVTCTYRFSDHVLVVRHDAPHRDVAAALMAMGLVLAIAAYAAPGRRRDEAVAARG